MNRNIKHLDPFRPMVTRTASGLVLALLLAACASTTVPITSPQGSAGPAGSKTALRSGAAAGGAGSADGAGGTTEFNAAAGSDGAPADGFDIRRADGRSGRSGGAGGDALAADDPNGMSAGGGNGDSASGGTGGAGRNGTNAADAASAPGRQGGSAAGGANAANGAAGSSGADGSKGSNTAGGGAGSKGDTAVGPGSTGDKSSGAGGPGSTGDKSSGAGGAGGNGQGGPGAAGTGAGGPGGGDKDPTRVAIARTDAGRSGVDAIGADAAAERRGRVDTANNGVQIDRDERSVTLDGFLPTTLGMGEGQFEFDRFTLSDDVKAKLDAISEKLGAEPYDRLYITGYSDRIGDTAYNKALSEKRAWAVAGYLMDKGIPPEKLKVEGKGEANSLVAGGECMVLRRAELIQCLERDRRVELLATVKEYNLKVK